MSSRLIVNSIRHTGASGDAVTLANDGTCTAKITNNLSNRRININGAMQVAQRGTSSTSTGYKTVDRFYNGSTGTDEGPTFAQVDVASGTTPYTLGFRKALKLTNGNQTSGAGATDTVYIEHQMEAQDIANSGWNYTSSSSYITLSFWVKSSVAQDFKGYLRSVDGTSQIYPYSTGSLTADTWTKITKTIPGNSNLTFDNDNGSGLQLYLWPYIGTDYTDAGVTENAWAAYASGTRTPVSTTTWYTTNDATLEITGIQLEVGDHATDFEHRTYAQEEILCQRYYNTDGIVLADSNSYRYYNTIVLNVEMRALPTISLGAYDGGSGGGMAYMWDNTNSSTNRRTFYQYPAHSTINAAWFKFDAEL
tara:strand:+ start:844 stop:1935 length:1092 start_codon:yes stop_codon:yes gene_type:complete